MEACKSYAVIESNPDFKAAFIVIQNVFRRIFNPIQRVYFSFKIILIFICLQDKKPFNNIAERLKFFYLFSVK